MTLSHFIDIDRQEALYLLIKKFLTRSVVMHGAIPDDLECIDALLCGCVRDRALLAEHGFELCAHRAEDPDCGGHTVWLAQRAR